MNYLNFDDIPFRPDLSEVLLDFCESNGITDEDIYNIENSEMARNMTTKIINPILSTWGIKTNTSTEDIYIRDIIGLDPYTGIRNLLGILNKTYKDSGQAYGRRDNDMLKLSIEKMIKELEKSYKFEPICLDNIEDNKHVVSSNGCHRIAILKFLYIHEILKGEKTKEEIDEKFKIKANVSYPDMELSYINYLLGSNNIIRYMGCQYGKNAIHTGKFIITFNDGNEKIMTKDEVINTFIELINQNLGNINENALNEINGFTKSIPSFRNFVSKYIPTLVKENEYGSLN